MPIISQTQLSILRSIGRRALSTPVEIWKRTVTETDFGTSETWQKSSTELGWMRQTQLGALAADEGVVTSVGQYRLHVGVDANVAIGDKVVVNGEEFTVVDTNVENSYRIYTTLTLRRRQP